MVVPEGQPCASLLQDQGPPGSFLPRDLTEARVCCLDAQCPPPHPPVLSGHPPPQGTCLRCMLACPREAFWAGPGSWMRAPTPAALQGRTTAGSLRTVGSRSCTMSGTERKHHRHFLIHLLQQYQI